MRFLYLLIDCFTVIIPFIFSFHPKIKFYKTWKAFIIAAFFITLMFIIWDAVFTHLGVWSFNKRYILKIYFLGLPFEEILFFICIPFSCVFTYFCLDKFYNLSWNPKTEKIFCIIFSFSLLITGFIFIDNLYTSVTFISAAVLCLVLKFLIKIDWIGKAFTVYTFLLLPFLIVNGLLTGTGLQEPVVIYNNSENLGIRLFTIPIEDFFYGLELFLFYLTIYLPLAKSKNPLLKK